MPRKKPKRKKTPLQKPKRAAFSTSSEFDEYINSDCGCGPSTFICRYRPSPQRSAKNARSNRRASSITHSIASPSEVPLGTIKKHHNKNSQVKTPDQEKDSSGYNSGDEYGRYFENMTKKELNEKEKLFEEVLRKKGYLIKNMCEDGACMFRAVADQIYSDQEMHTAVRKLCMDYIAQNSEHYSQYVTEDFNKYVQRKRCDGTYGNHIEMQAMSELFNRSIEVYQYSSEPINIFHGSQKTNNDPIRLSYHKNIHYNSIIDPYKATVNVGFELPAFTSVTMNKSSVTEAIRAAEKFQLKQNVLED